MDGASDGQKVSFQSSFNTGYEQGFSFGFNLGFKEAQLSSYRYNTHLFYLWTYLQIN